MIPALRAARTSPVEGLATGYESTPRLPFPRGVAALLLLWLGAAASILATVNDTVRFREIVFVVGATALLAAVLAGGPWVGAATMRLAAGPFRLFGIAGRIAQRNARRNPRRTASTASALAIGMTVVVIVAVLAESSLASFGDAVDAQISADAIVDTGLLNPVGGGLPTELATTVRELDEVGSVARIRTLAGTLIDPEGSEISSGIVAGVDNPEFFELLDVGVSSGSTEDLIAGRVAISETDADALGVGVGDQVNISYPQAGTQNYRVAAIYANNVGPARYLIPIDSMDSLAGPDFLLDRQLYIKTGTGASTQEMLDAIQGVLDRYSPAASATDVSTWVGDRTEPFRILLRLVYVLMIFTVVVALIGIANTLTLSIWERRREIGLFRVVGATRPQLVSSLILESTLIALLGSAGGIALGAWLGVGLVRVVGQDSGISVHVPLAQLGVALIAGIAAGTIAGLFPSMRASRAPVLSALSEFDS